MKIRQNSLIKHKENMFYMGIWIALNFSMTFKIKIAIKDKFQLKRDVRWNKIINIFRFTRIFELDAGTEPNVTVP